MKTKELPLQTVGDYFLNRKVIPSSHEVMNIALAMGSDAHTLFNIENIAPHFEAYQKEVWSEIKSTNFNLYDCDRVSGLTYIGWYKRENDYRTGLRELHRIIVIQMAIGDGGQYDNNLRIEGTMEQFVNDYQVTAIYRIPLEDMFMYNLKNQN